MRLCILLLMVLLACTARAQPLETRGDTLRISLLTFAPGEAYWQRFGHNAILVEDTATGANAVYNYGMFDFAQKNFFLNFARGHMVYWLAVDSLERTLAFYAREGRWVMRQVLQLDAAQRLELADFLDRNAQPEQRNYRYDYFRDNCSTRVRDALDRAFGGAVRRQLEARPADTSYRFEATRLIAPIAPLAAGMDLVMGAAGDAPLSVWQQSFVPEVLMQAMRTLTIEGRPAVASEDYLVTAPDAPVAPLAPLRLWPFTLAAGLALGLLLPLLAKRREVAAARIAFAALATGFWLFCFVGGAIMAAGWALTEHWAVAANRNLLLANPLCLLLMPAAFFGARSARMPAVWPLRLAIAIAALAGLTLLLPLLPGAQVQWPWIAFFLPVHLGLACALRSLTDPSRD